MKRLTFSLLLIVATVLASAQTINGDINHSGKLEVSDVTHLISNYLTGKADTINADVNHYAVDNSLVAGKWYNTAGATFLILNADGTTGFSEGYTYKFLPSQGRILFFNAAGVPVSSLNVTYIAEGYLAILPAGSDVPVLYTAREPENPLNNGREYVDLGLSVKWATVSIGAISPEDYNCDMYAWGETQTKDSYTWANYKFGNYEDKTLRKYNNYSNYGWTDKLTTLEEADDVAHVCWGGTWRMPTRQELSELVNKCTWAIVERNGRSVQEATGPNGNKIYFCSGKYWSSSLYDNNCVNAYYLSIWGESVKTDWYSRCEGRYVRAVCK